MRVLMAVPKYPYPVVGGLERQSHELAKALNQRGHSVLVVSSRFETLQGKVEAVDGSKVYRVQWFDGRLARFILSPFRLGWLLFRLRAEADVVHVHNISWFGAYVTVVAKMLGLPVITKLPNIGSHGIPGIREKQFGRLRVAALKQSDVIVAMTAKSRAELIDIGYPLSRVLNVANGIAVLQERKRGSHRNPASKVTVAYVGRLISQKGLPDLLHAWTTVRSRTTRSVLLRLVGDGPQRDEIREMVMALKIGDSVELCGYREDVSGELSRSDVFVLPSYSEGNSNAILEAMRAGLPIVATSVGGARCQVGRDGERYLVAPGDRQGLAERLVELIEDDELRQRVGNEMSKRIELLFTIESVAAIYEDAYRLLLLGKRDEVGALNKAYVADMLREERSCAE